MGGFIAPLASLFVAKKAFSTPSAPAPVTVNTPAPAVRAPEADIAQKTTEGDLSVNRKKRRGKASLIIDKTNSTNTGTGSSGLNI